MGRKKEEINELCGFRLKELLKEHNKSQIWLAEQLGYVPQHVNLWATNKRHLPEEQARKIASLFPGTRYEWLMGYDDCKSNAEQFANTINKMNAESDLLMRGIVSFAHLSGFTIEVTSPAFQSGHSDSIENVLKWVRDGYTISRNGEAAILNLEDFNELENEICDYVEMRLARIIRKQNPKEDLENG